MFIWESGWFGTETLIAAQKCLYTYHIIISEIIFEFFVSSTLLFNGQVLANGSKIFLTRFRWTEGLAMSGHQKVQCGIEICKKKEKRRNWHIPKVCKMAADLNLELSEESTFLS